MLDDKYIECPDCHEIKIYLNYQPNTGLFQRLLFALRNKKKTDKPEDQIVGTCPECGCTITYAQVDHMLHK